MTIGDYLSVGGMCVVIGFVVGTNLASYMEIPQTAYEKKVEGDEREFLIIESKGRYLPMVKTAPNEPFRRLEDVSKETLDSEGVKMDDLIRKVLEK